MDAFKELIEEKKEYSIDEMKQLFRDVREAELEYTQKKAESSAAHAELEKAKHKFISAMKEANLTRWEGDDEFSGFTMYDDLRFRTPKDVEAKVKFLDFLKSDKVANLLEQDSKQIYNSYVTVNSNSLNSLCKKLVELAAENGESIELPGIADPTHEPKLRSLPRRKK